MRRRWLAPFVLLAGGAVLGLLTHTSTTGTVHGQTPGTPTRYVPVPATVTLAPGDRVTFVVPRLTLPPVEPEFAYSPRQLLVVSIADQPATVIDDGIALTITAMPEFVVLTDQPCAHDAQQPNVVSCTHTALAPQGDGGVTFTVADRSTAQPLPQHARLAAGGQVSFVAPDTTSAIAFRYPRIPFEPATTIDVTWEGQQVTLSVPLPVQVFVPGQHVACAPQTGPASVLHCGINSSTPGIITVYATDPTVPGHSAGPPPTPGPRLSVAIDPTAVGAVAQPVTLHVQASVDQGGVLEAFIWDFGDGSLGTGASPEHTYAVPGVYAATPLVVASNAVAVGARTFVYIVREEITPAALPDLHQIGTSTLPAASVLTFAPPSSPPPVGATAVPEQFLRVQIGNLSPQPAEIADDGQTLTIKVAAGNTIQLAPPVAAHWGCSFSTPNSVRCPVGPPGLHILAFDVVPYAGDTPTTSVNYPAGWNLVAGPVGTSLFTVVPPPETATTWIYTWLSGAETYEALPVVSPFHAGQGYWAYFDTPVTVPLNVAGPESAPVDLPGGRYAQIGNPGNTPVTVSGADMVYVYDPGTGRYQATTVLQPGQGAWAYAATDVEVSLTPTGLRPDVQTGEQEADAAAHSTRVRDLAAHAVTDQE